MWKIRKRNDAEPAILQAGTRRPSREAPCFLERARRQEKKRAEQK
jgi:hypothetical protein